MSARARAETSASLTPLRGALAPLAAQVASRPSRSFSARFARSAEGAAFAALTTRPPWPFAALTPERAAGPMPRRSIVPMVRLRRPDDPQAYPTDGPSSVRLRAGRRPGSPV
jgi:hypothetical protein